MIIGLSAPMGTGKDAFAEHVKKRWNIERVAFADPLKRICKDVFAFTDQQLWGPSQERNKPDRRYSRGSAWVCKPCRDLFHPSGVEEKTTRYNLGKFTQPQCFYCDTELDHDKNDPSSIGVFLTPRFALQTLGTEWGRTCYSDVWLDMGIRTAKVLLDNPTMRYDFKTGLWSPGEGSVDDGEGAHGVVIPDCRFKNELTKLKASGGFAVRLRRPGAKAVASVHPSEKEQLEIPDSFFNAVLVVPEGLGKYWDAIDGLIEELKLR